RIRSGTPSPSTGAKTSRGGRRASLRSRGESRPQACADTPPGSAASGGPQAWRLRTDSVRRACLNGLPGPSTGAATTQPPSQPSTLPGSGLLAAEFPRPLGERNLGVRSPHSELAGRFYIVLSGVPLLATRTPRLVPSFRVLQFPR